MKQDKQQLKNSEDVKILIKDLHQKTEIDQKCLYYKSIIKAYDELSTALGNKIDNLEANDKNLSDDDSVTMNKLIIEKLDIQNSIFEKKKFYEMWLKRKKENDITVEKVTEDCNKNFDEYLAKAKEFALKNVKLKSHLDLFEKEEEVTQDKKNSFYLLIKYEVIKLTGKGVFAIQ
jgi:hypothetical protein